MAKGLIDWALEQPAWVGDCLRRIALAADNGIDDHEFDTVAANVRHAAGAGPVVTDCMPLSASHIGAGASEQRRTVLAQLGPVQNIDRLAPDQRLRMAPEGITLVYGENGSGKSGYTRIAKRLCRSLSSDQLRGNVFAAGAGGAMRVEVRYRVGDDDVVTLDWDPSEPVPTILQQISVFDSHNARLYVGGDNRIAYLPRELAILEHHGDICQRLDRKFGEDAKQLASRMKVALPAGYTQGTAISATLANLHAKSDTLPSADDLRALAALSEEEQQELVSLAAELASDPVAMAAVRRRGATILKRVTEVFGQLGAELSEAVGNDLTQARSDFEAASQAARLSAAGAFAGEPMPGVGGDTWRILFEAARAFATDGAEPLEDRLPDSEGDLCLLCLEPLSSSAAMRLARFNAFVSSDATRRADTARDRMKALTDKIAAATVPAGDVVADSLAAYSALGAERAGLVQQITAVITEFAARRGALLDVALPPVAALSVAAIMDRIRAECTALEVEAASLQNSAVHASVLDAKRARLAELKDRQKLGHDLETVLQRRDDVVAQKALANCLAQVGTRAVSTQITALRKVQVTEALQNRILEEILAFDLSHIPFMVTDSSSGGQSLFSVGLKGAGKTKTNQILSEGEQRALALACFLAEIGGDDARYGIIVDDPVSSLDHLRVRKVAQRLVAEAAKGRQVIIFTHNIVFFNEVISEAARMGADVPLVKSVVRKTQAAGFGVIEENSEPWVADLNARILDLRTRAATLGSITDFDTDSYRRQAKDFYSDLRESWERAVEEVVLAKTVVRFVPDVMTARLKEVCVTDEDYRTIHFAMKRASERSGHDMSAGRTIAQPTPDEMAADLKALDDFRIDYVKRRKGVAATRSALEQPVQGGLI